MDKVPFDYEELLQHSIKMFFYAKRNDDKDIWV